ncbi:hypothetical protein GMD78_20935 [Ornithinibacillus sp. L9]|uniref:Uncharacterized protein n=1 Tax=Ornithinibacillus caprae TaxID=2678566 RepID=A0A6N8FRE7_9BACI|nr:hypothetical protein [Ornithinibacillus caprae]MUK90819.1 hypothetical protein [Ornithinibacillus caprae]
MRTYKQNKVTDNNGKRVLLILDDNGEKEYKTIFIKDTNCLKIIDLDDGEIYNEIIK